MVGAAVFLTLLPVWVACSGEGNIRLLEDEVAVALKACINPNEIVKEISQRQRRSDDSYDTSPRIDDDMKQINTYSHEKSSSNDTKDQIYVLNGTDYDYEGGNRTMQRTTSIPRPVIGENKSLLTSVNTENTNRTKRSEPLFNKSDSEQCLSQCVFANLQVVDSRGIPREAELWNKVQASVKSQQSRAAIRDQIRACFQELQSEAEDDGCSYSNKLERCLMLRFSDRKTAVNQTNQNQAKDQKSTA